MTSLFTAHDMPAHRLPNRVVMAPMSRVRSNPEGLATPEMATYYAQRATAGLIISEGVQPSLQGQSNPNSPGLHDEAQAESWKQVTAAVHANGGRIHAQLMHGGRVAHPDTAGFHPVAPSAVQLNSPVFTPTGLQLPPVPRALETHEVAGEAESYAQAATRAVEAGFDGVELHGANGYLIQQFLATGTNHRTDAYGGPVKNRIRFAVEAAEATAAAIGPDRVGIRLSPAGTVWETEEADVPELYEALLTELARLDLAYIHVLATSPEDHLLALRKSWPATFILNPGGQINPHPTTLESANHWLAQGADLISFGRPFIANPDLVERLRTNLPLAQDDKDTWYQGGKTGFIDYPTYQH